MILNYKHTTDEDLPRLKAWTEADPDHQTTSGEFWLVPKDAEGNLIPGVQCITVEDKDGPVFNLRFENVIRVHVQFPPASKEKLRIAKALKQTLGIFAPAMKKKGYHEMIFLSVSAGLVGFFKKLGFSKVEDNYSVKL